MRPIMNCSHVFKTLPLVLFPVLAGGCASTEKKEKPPVTQAADVPAEGKPKAPALDVAVVAASGAAPGSFHLVLDTLVKQDGQSLTAEWRLPTGVTAADPSQLKAERGAVAAGDKQAFALDVTVDEGALATGVDVVCVASVGFGGVNRDTVTRLLHLGAPAAAANPQSQPTATGTDATGKPIRESRAGH